MAGHSKWTQIKRKKGVEDAKRSKLFSSLTQAITTEVRQGRGDRQYPPLRQAIERARAANMPTENIERAITKATEESSEETVTVLYEAYSSGGAALLIGCLTDNKNRTGQEIKHLLAKSGANLTPPGTAIWAFEKTGSGWQPKTSVALDPENQENLNQLLILLRSHPDVKEIFTNAGDRS